MDPELSAPPVVVVVIADEPGEWFEQTLAALDAQDYPNQSVLVMDIGPRPISPRWVAGTLTDAYVRRSQGVGFAAVANDVLRSVQGAAFLLFCHADVALERPALRLLVEEALRSNAGIVAPKVVEWDRPDHLLEVGMAIDKTGAAGPLVERGELDQEQHDAVRDVFAVSSTCMLVRNDLFTTLGGFDAVLGDHGGDIDLCWRAQVVGARVVVAPQARVRHRVEAVTEPAEGIDGSSGIETRSHLRTMFKSYSVPHLARVVPQAAVVTVVEALLALATGRFRAARQLGGAWWWNLRRLKQLRPLRRAVRDTRTVADSEVRRLQVRGSVRLNAYLQRRLHAQERARALVAAGEHLVDSVWNGPSRAAGILLSVLVLALVIGSRHLLFGRLPAVGELAPLPAPTTLLSHYLSGWRTTGMGSPSAAPSAFGILGLLGGLFVGKMALLAKVLVLAVWPVGALGAWRASRPLASPLPRLVGLIAYLAVPLSYNAVSRGNLGGLLAYAAAPWILRRLLAMSGLEPFGRGGVESRQGTRRRKGRPPWLDAVALAILLGVVGSVDPGIGVATLLAALGLMLGSAVVGGVDGGARVAMGAAGALGISAVLLFPWSLGLLTSGGWTTVTGVPGAPARGAGFGQLLRFEIGPLGAPPLGWAFLLVAALPLVLARGWRLAWAARLWMVAAVCVGVAWAGGRGLIPLRFDSPATLLAPAAAALAMSAALGAAAFEVDLRGYRFGWRQAASVGAGAVLALATVPVLAAVPDGRWRLPAQEVARSVGWMQAEAAGGSFRVLWVGDPDVLPLDGWALEPGLAYATSRNGAPSALDLLPGPPSPDTRAIAAALRQASTGGTARLGRLLAPLAIRYVVVPRQLATGAARPPVRPPSPVLAEALGSQLDLRLLPSDAAASVFQNEAWGPVRSVLAEAPQTADSSDNPVTPPLRLGTGSDLSRSIPVFNRGGPAKFRGTVATSGQVLVSESSSSGWRLSVGGRAAPRRDGFGLNSFTVAQPGPAVLQYRSSPLRYGLLIFNLVAWTVTVRLAWRGRRSG